MTVVGRVLAGMPRLGALGPRPPRLGRWLPWILFAVASTLVATAAIISTTSGTGDVFNSGMLMWVLTLVFGSVGALVASRHSRNPIGWIFLGASLAASSTVLSESYASYYVQTGSGPPLLGESVAAFGTVSWIPFIVVPATFVLLLMPQGHVLTPRWRWVGWSAGVGTAGTFIAQGVVAGPIPDYPGLDNPFGIDSAWVVPAQVITMLLVAVGIVGSVSSLVVRFRRARGEERLQLKWLALAGVVAAVTILVSTTAGYALLGADLSNALIVLSVMGLPSATGIAILRYRLYDIDLVINRALVYGSLTATLAATYVGTVLLLQLALSGVTEGSGLAVAASTLAVAALFRPVRAQIQQVVDRRFFRNRYDATLIVGAFGARLRDEVDLSTLSTDLLAAVHATVQPSHASLWFRSETHPG